MIVAIAFKKFECEIMEAANGVEGLAVASREKPDLILLDVTMPVMDGPEMLAKLKANPELKNIPVVMLTAEAGRDSVLRIARLGVRDYLIKPFKEELLLERVGRIVELKPKGTSVAKPKRYDDPLTLLVVDDKPAIVDQIRNGLADRPWSITGQADPAPALALCTQTPPDVVLISLSLPGEAAHAFFLKTRSNFKIKHIPVFGMCVKTAVGEQDQALQQGFNACITKPIDFSDLRVKIIRALNLDTSYRYFEQRDGALLVKVPTPCGPFVVNDISVHLREQATQAVDAGLDKLILDLSAVATVDIGLIELGLSVVKLAQELSLRNSVIGSETLRQECRNFDEAKDWRFCASFAESVEVLKN